MNKLLLFPAAAAALLLASAHPPEMESVVAAPPPPQAVAPAPAPAPAARVAASSDYPPCTATRTDRCTQVRGYRHRAPERRRVQLAMRAGERG